MTEAEILKSVKQALGITGTFLDNTLKMYIEEVLAYLMDAGVSKTVALSSAAVGVITRGVSDLWNYGSAGGKLSEYFYQRVVQLAYKPSEGGDSGE